MKLSEWKIRLESETPHLQKGSEIKASVPGDITWDLHLAGIIKNPYFSLNHKELGWIAEQDFTYITEFDFGDEVNSAEEVILSFGAIDLFSEIYLNGVLLGKTENAFLKYEFEVKKYLKAKSNLLEVKMFSTVNRMKTIDCDGYFGVFNVPRLFLRKPQCHFGWDWAPDLCGYGICGDAEIKVVSRYRISDVCVRQSDDGFVTLIAELNYNVRAMMDAMGVTIDNTATPRDGDKLVFRAESSPGGGKYLTEEIEVTGKKNFVNFKIENPELWWPKGYGGQPLYRYEVELVRGGRSVCSRAGRFAFRQVELSEKPKSCNTLGYDFLINGKKIFVKGSNWVPAECFSGIMTDEKCKKLIDLAARANVNMLRIWGGGSFERDYFYDYCDEQGIMVWQDFMYACSDIPDDDKAWIDNTVRECEYQIKRLRNHPSLVYWCGGNEKTGTYGLQISKGDYFINCVLTGLVRTLDPTRPFARQSPCSITDVGNDLTSGESHYNSFEASLAPYVSTGRTAIADYRKLVSEKVVSFASECAIFGPNSEETNEKIYPEDKLWPFNEIWADRLMDNPYAGIPMPFYKRQLLYVRDMYDEAENLHDFTVKGMTVHAEALRCELEFARMNKDVCGGIMNWMFTDIWPSGTWSIIDYYLEPKQAYYQVKRSFRPLLASFAQNKDGTTEFFVANDTPSDFSGKAEFGKKNIDGSVVCKETLDVFVPAGGVFKRTVTFDVGGKNTYLYAVCGGEKTLYSPSFWRNCDLKADYEVQTQKVAEDKLKLTVTAKSFVKGLFIGFKNNFEYLFDDNYFDLEAGDVAAIYVTRKGGIGQVQPKTSAFERTVK